MRGDRTVDEAPEVRTDFVCAALVGGVTACALLEHGFTGRSIGLEKQRLDIDFDFCGAAGTGFRRALFGNDREAFLLGSLGVENAFRCNGHGHQNEDRPQKGTHAHVHI
ncbi:hypothetical protein D9M70_610480 [compost metagenome]